MERKFKYRHYGSLKDMEDVIMKVSQIMASNMDGVGTFEMADRLGEQSIFTCSVKTYSVGELVGYFDEQDCTQMA